VRLQQFQLACAISSYNHSHGDSSSKPQLGILAHAFPPSKMRSIAFATFAAGAPLGAAVGNTLGAILTQLSESVTFSPHFPVLALSHPLHKPHMAFRFFPLSRP